MTELTRYERPLLKFITCGSVDDGKSTLIGNILSNSKLLYTDQIESLKTESLNGSCDGELDYSLLLDGLLAEREQGITIDVAYRYFATKKSSPWWRGNDIVREVIVVCQSSKSSKSSSSSS